MVLRNLDRSLLAFVVAWANEVFLSSWKRTVSAYLENYSECCVGGVLKMSGTVTH